MPGDKENVMKSFGHWAIGPFAVVLLVLVAAFPGRAQDQMTAVTDPAFTHRVEPPAIFDHDAHNDNAAIGDCSVCHHVYKNGKLVAGESSEDEKCSQCHNPKGMAAAIPLRRAFHLRCLSCHIQENTGPVACGACHPKKAGGR